MEIRIGAGGWQYFNVGKTDRLRAYARAFDLTEVNSTFYEFPSKKLAQSWRNRVPNNFEFSVRCHYSLTHQLKFAPSRKVFEILDKMRRICQLLRASILHFQTPPTLKWSSSKILDFENFVSSLNSDGLRLAMETRSEAKIPLALFRVMSENNIIHSVDISKEQPKVESDILYSRLFGKGHHTIYQFSDNELEAISKSARSAKNRALLAFHNVRMYKDAGRLKIYQQTDRFASITKFVDLESLKEVLAEDACFPATKQELIEAQGWKLYDVRIDRRERVSNALERLPEKTYQNLGELITALKTR
ncbi:MAG: DUF72 domain-containing protein [Candidatus Bathyarchaeia archaeon]